MDSSALIIEIGKRAKAKERAEAGESAEVDETEEDSGVDDIKASAVEEIVTALGLKVEDVDTSALASALQDFADACAVKKAPKKVAD